MVKPSGADRQWRDDARATTRPYRMMMRTGWAVEGRGMRREGMSAVRERVQAAVSGSLGPDDWAQDVSNKAAGHLDGRRLPLGVRHLGSSRMAHWRADPSGFSSHRMCRGLGNGGHTLATVWKGAWLAWWA